ncbi:hypothetical protein BGZ76_010018, partial [Entomortierella beljakovae]
MLNIHKAEEFFDALFAALHHLNEQSKEREEDAFKSRLAHWEQEIQKPEFKQMAIKCFHWRAARKTESPAIATTSRPAVTLTILCILSGEMASNAFPVELSPENAVGNLKKAIFEEIRTESDIFKAKDLVLWHISMPTGEERVNTADSIEIKKDPKLQEENEDLRGGKSITVLNGPSTPTKLGIMDVIKKVQDSFHIRGRGSDTAPQVSSIMPLQERSMEKATGRVVENVGICLSSQKDNQAVKSMSSFLVCSGAAGI